MLSHLRYLFASLGYVSNQARPAKDVLFPSDCPYPFTKQRSCVCVCFVCLFVFLGGKVGGGILFGLVWEAFQVLTHLPRFVLGPCPHFQWRREGSGELQPERKKQKVTAAPRGFPAQNKGAEKEGLPFKATTKQSKQHKHPDTAPLDH